MDDNQILSDEVFLSAATPTPDDDKDKEYPLTRQPYVEYLPRLAHKNEPNIYNRNHRDWQFKLRFEVLIYAAACYPSKFSRTDAFQLITMQDRTQQRILKSLAIDGFLMLEKDGEHNCASSSFRLNLSKFDEFFLLLNKKDRNFVRKNTKILSARHSKYIPQPRTLEKDIKVENVTQYLHMSLRVDIRFSVLVYAAAWYPNFFSRQEAMQKLDINNRTQQRLFKSLVIDGFLEEHKVRNCVYYQLIPSSLDQLKELLVIANKKAQLQLIKNTQTLLKDS